MTARLQVSPFFACVIAALTVGCLPATNPWDPDTDPALQVPGTIRGTISYPDRPESGGIAVEIVPLPVLPSVASTETSDALDGAFAIQVQPGTYWVRATAVGYGQLLSGPFTLVAGERLDIGRQTLPYAPANAAIGGTVSTGDTFSQRGIKVTAARRLSTGACEPPAGEAVTDENGAYRIDGLRPGTYVVAAFVEGATVALSAPTTLVANTVIGVDLAIRNGSAALLLRDPITGSDVFTRESTVRVTIDDTFSWATEMNLSDDATFGTSTGWQTFNTETNLTLSSTFTGLARSVVYAKFRSPCATSPLYSDDIIFDDAAPVILSARLEGIDGLSRANGLGVESAQPPPLVVVPDTRQTLLLAIDAFDITGVRIDVVIIDDAGGETPVADFEDVWSTDSLALVRHAVPIPTVEGLSNLRVDVTDIAGNVKVFAKSLSFRVLRDLKAPTSPLPAVTSMVVSSDTAYIWLSERTCILDDETTTIALVCEENPKETGFFEVRGGPAFIDFTPFDNPPFAVPVHKDGVTSIEIRAVDLAGNASASVGSVTVTHTSTRTLLTLPSDREFAGTPHPKLTSLAGTAFYEVARKPQATNATQYPVLVAQPAYTLGIDVNPTTAGAIDGLRHLNWGCRTDLPATVPNCQPSSRRAGPLAASQGALHWLEFSGMAIPQVQPIDRRARLFTSRPTGNGRFHIASIPSTVGNLPVLDAHGNPTQRDETCEKVGRTDCVRVDAWSGVTQRGPNHLFVDGDRIAINGVGTVPLPLGDQNAVPTTEVVSGPALIAMQLNVRNVAALLGLRFELDVEAEIPLRTALFRRTSPTGNFNGTPSVPSVDEARLGILTSGLGVETFYAADELQIGSASSESFLIGALIPAGVTVTFAKRPNAVDDGLYSVHDPYRIDGLVVLPLVDEQPDSFTTAQILPALRAGEALSGSLLIQDPDYISSFGSVNGVTRIDRGVGASLTAVTTPASTLDLETTAKHRTLARSPLERESIHVVDRSLATLESPDSCVVIFDVEEEVTLRDLRLEGRGMLDQIYVHAFKSQDGESTGYYDSAPIFGSIPYIPLTSEGTPTECRANELAVLETVSFTGSVEQTLLFSDSVAAAGDVVFWTGVAPSNAMGPSTVLPMEPSTIGYEIYLGPNPINDPGDADLYASYGVDPTLTVNDLYSFQDGSSEYIYAANTGAGDLHVAVSGWQGVAGYEAFAVRMERLTTVQVPAGSTLRATMTGTGDADLYVRFDGEPNFFDWDCSPYIPSTSNEECEVVAHTSDRVAHVAVAYYDSAIVNIQLDVISTTLPQLVATVPLGDANNYRISVANPSTATVYVGHGFIPGLSTYDCRVTSGNNPCTPSPSKIPITGDLYVSVLPTGDTASYDISITKTEHGCEAARAWADNFGTYAEGTFTPGVYALTFGRAIASFQALSMPASAPKVYRGPRIAGDGSVRFLGAPSSTSIAPGLLTVGGVSANVPACDMELTFDTTVSYSRMVFDDERTLALKRRTNVAGTSSTTLVVLEGSDEVAPKEPVVLVDFGEDRRVWELTKRDAHAAWLESTKSGDLPTVHALPVVDGEQVGEVCDPSPLALLVSPLQITSTSMDGRILLVGGRSATGNAVHLFELGAPEAGDTCPTVKLMESIQVDGVPMALHASGRDIFAIIAQDGLAPRLMHYDRRDVVPLFAGGALEAVGFDLDGGDVALALGPAFLVGDGHLVLLEEEAGTLDSVSVARASLVLHPRFVPGGVLAIVRNDGGPLELRAYPKRPHEGTPVDVEGALSSATVPLATDPFLHARTPLLDSEGSTVALLGYENGGRTLRLYEMLVVDDGNEVTVVSQLTFGPLAVDALPSFLQVTNETTVVTWADGSSLVVRRNGSGAWSVDDAAHTDGERVIATFDNALLVFQDPGSIFIQKPPTILTGQLRSSTHVTPIDFPADGYTHAFTGVGQLSDGDIILYDESATPGLLWRIDRAARSFLPAEGPHRPLLVGTEGIGASATPRVSGDSVYYIRRTSTGNALYRMRL